MGISRKQLVPTTALTGTAAAVYTVPNLVQAQVTAAVAINTAATAVALKLYIVPTGGSVSASNQVTNKSLLASDSISCNDLLGQTLPAGTAIYAEGAAINITISGVEFTQ